MTRGSDLIATERTRQITEEDHSVESDRDQADLLARAGVEYANVSVSVLRSGRDAAFFDPPLRWGWPWANVFWKPTGDPVRDLTKSGALIAAAIDSLIAAGWEAPEPAPKVVTLEDVYEVTGLGALVGEARSEGAWCCDVGCGSGACETCPCCCAGACVSGADGVPEHPENRGRWLEVAAEHNAVAAALRDAERRD